MIFLHSHYLQFSEYQTGKKRDLEAFLSNTNRIGLDIETTGLDPHTDTISLIQLSNKEGEIHLIAADKLHELINLLNQSTRVYIIHNAKFDLKFLFKSGLDYTKVNVFDTYLIECLLTNSPNKTERNLRYLLMKYLGVTVSKEEQKDWIGLNYKNITKNLLEYAINDVNHLHELLHSQWQDVVKNDLKEACKLECKFVKALAKIELNGIKLDKEIWKRNLEGNVEAQNQLVTNLMENVGREINLNSPQQLKEVLKDFGYDLPLNSEGKETVNKEKLKSLKRLNDNNFLNDLLDYKEKSKLVNSFGETYFNHINPATGRIHCNFNQIMNTTRMSSSSPNMQNLPRANVVREAFVAESGYKLIMADYSSQEVIILADLANEENIIDYYKNAVDIHSKNASIIYQALTGESKEINKEQNPVWKDKLTYRDLAKKVVFKLAYGGTAYTLTQDLECGEEVANAIINALNKAYKMQTKWQVKKMKDSLSNGFIEFNAVTKGKYFHKDVINYTKELCLYGYSINTTSENEKPLIYYNPNLKGIYNPNRVKEIKSEIGAFFRKCQNYPIQATGANIIKQAIINITNYFITSNLDAKVINTVHDEILVEVKEEMAEMCKEIIEKGMVKAGQKYIKSCDIKVDTHIADYWQK